MTIPGEGHKIFKIFFIEFCQYITLFHTLMSKYSPQSTVFLDILTLHSPTDWEAVIYTHIKQPSSLLQN